MKTIHFSKSRLFIILSIFVFQAKSVNATVTCVVGKYTGTGAALTVSGLGFQPDVVIIKATTNAGGIYIKTSTMAASASRAFRTTGALVTTRIDGFTSDGFTVTNAAQVNTNGTTYYFTAFKASSSVEVGTYSGDNSDPQTIAIGSGNQARFVLVIPNGAAGGYCYSSKDGTAYAYFYDDASGNGSGSNTSGAASNGFLANAHGNTSGITYHYVAWVNTTGICQVDKYTGNGANNRNITLTGTTFRPGFMLITYFGTNLIMRNDKYGATDATQDYSAIADAADMIQTFNSNGFQVGQDASVNTSSTIYTYLAMGGADYSILPIELLNFNVHCSSDNKGVNIHWTTASESNNDFFTIERSTDGITFQDIGTVKGAGNSSTELDYNFVDDNPVEEGITNYYRLRQTDYNGESKTFKTLAPDCQQQNSSFELSIVQNPVQGGTLFYDLTSDHDGLVQMEVINMLGQVVKQGCFYNRRGANLYSIPVSDLSGGIHYLRVSDKANQKTVKFIKL